MNEWKIANKLVPKPNEYYFWVNENVKHMFQNLFISLFVGLCNRVVDAKVVVHRRTSDSVVVYW